MFIYTKDYIFLHLYYNKSIKNIHINLTKKRESGLRTENLELREIIINKLLNSKLHYKFINKSTELIDNVFFFDKEFEYSLIKNTYKEIDSDEKIDSSIEEKEQLLEELVNLSINPKDIYHISLIKNIDLFAPIESFSYSIASSIRSMDSLIEFNFPLFLNFSVINFKN